MAAADFSRDEYRAVREALSKVVPDEVCEEMGIACGTCYIEAMVMAMAYRALKGDVSAFSVLERYAEAVNSATSETVDDFSLALMEIAKTL